MALLPRSEGINTLHSSTRPDVSGVNTPSASTRPIWLDLLPLDVCTRIASYICGAKHSRSPLYLAEVSSTQASAVLSALSYKLEIPVTSRDLSVLLSRWTAVAAPILLEFHLTDFSPATRRYHLDRPTRDAIIRLFATAPNLRKVTIDDEFAFLNPLPSPYLRGFEQLTVQSPLASIPNLEELTIRIWSESHFSRWISVLASKNLRLFVTKLTVSCVFPICSFCYLDIFKQLGCAIARCCPFLVDFELVYSCSSYGERLNTIDVLNRFPKIRAITVNDDLKSIALAALSDMDEDLTTTTLAALSDMESIRINHPESKPRNYRHYMYEDLLALGTTITSLRTPLDVDAQQLAKLACCTRMKALDISVSGGAEVALSGVVRCMPALRELRIDTKSVLSEHGHYVMHTAAKGAFLETVNAAALLTVLCVTNVRVEWEELEKILNICGDRLEEFGTTIIGQEENPFDRLEHLLQAISKHTRNVRELHEALYIPVLREWREWSPHYPGNLRLCGSLRVLAAR